MHHETKSTLETTAWCNTCGRRTQHRVDDRRVGCCLEHGAKGKDGGYSSRQIKDRKRREKEEAQPKLL